MKIKIIEDGQGLVKDQIIENMCPISAGYLIETGKAVRLDAPVTAAPATAATFVPDNVLKKCKMDVLTPIGIAEKVEGAAELTKKPLVKAIIANRKLVAGLHQRCIDLGIDGHEDLGRDEMQAAIDQKEFDNNFGDRTECDDTCEFADGEVCNRPDGVMCQLDEPEPTE